MGQNDVERRGYPRSNLKRDFDLLLFCGGAGGGACPMIQTATGCKFAIDVNPFITHNRYLELHNTGFVHFFTDAGPDGSCSSSYGTPITWYLAFSVDGNLTAAEIIAQDNPIESDLLFSEAIYQIEGNKLPQPTNAAWANKIWIHIYWGSTAYVSGELFVDNVQYLKTVKHDFDVRQ